MQQTTNYVYFKNVQPGSYRFGITYSGHTPPFLPEPFVYPAQVLGTDRITRGNWGGVYGHDGYMLLGSGPHSTNTSHLPHYVKSVVLTAGRTMQWHSNDHDPRALATGPSNRRRRPAGVFYGSPIINIKLKSRRTYRLALYAVDFDHQGRKQLVTVESLRTRRILAPVQAFSRFSQGEYLVFQVHGGVRILLNPSRGPNAVISGIFFDPAGG